MKQKSDQTGLFCTFKNDSTCVANGVHSTTLHFPTRKLSLSLSSSQVMPYNESH